MVVAMTNEPHIKCILKYCEERKHLTVKGIYLEKIKTVADKWQGTVNNFNWAIPEKFKQGGLRTSLF